MTHDKKNLGIVVGLPWPKGSNPRQTVPEGRRLRDAFLTDLLQRFGKMKNASVTVFYPEDLPGGPPESLTPIFSKGYTTIRRVDAGADKPGGALGSLFDGPDRGCVVISGDCPDLPLLYVKRAYAKLKHQDVVVGPTGDGRLYLIGFKQPAPDVVGGIDWDRPSTLAQIIERAAGAGLTLSVLPLWYRADTVETLELLRDLLKAKRKKRSGRLPATEAVLEETIKHAGDLACDD